MIKNQAIVITGLGVVTPIGTSVPEFGDALRIGRSGITRWKRTYTDRYSQIGGDMSDFDLNAHFTQVGAAYPPALVKAARNALRATPQSGQLTAAAALQAYVDACLTKGALPPERCAHILAGHNLNSPYIYENNVTFQQEPEYIDPLYGILYLDTDVLAVISQILNLRGPAFSVGGACASGNLALLAALDLLRAGRADVALVTGGAGPLGPVTRQGWAMIGALAIKLFNDAPEAASRPFDARREGFVPSEGAAAVVLETLESAQARGATIYAHLLGAASTCNASRLTHPDHDAQVRVMRDALADAGIQPTQIDYVNAHATSTPAGDAAEVAALKSVLGDQAYRIPVNATKSLVGHCLTSAAIVELVATVIQMQHGFVHPTLNLTDPDPDLDLDFVPDRARAHSIHYALSNAFGFGGLNACVVVGQP
ncbi:MAG: beta-ketoacyl-[acyl-carrier-protein] synthase family protein [Caldilineaceae bacterium]